MGVTLLVVESAVVGFAVGDRVAFSLDGAALISAIDEADVFCAVAPTPTVLRLAAVTTTFFDNFGDGFTSVTTFVVRF
jgi:hypothetical protein